MATVFPAFNSNPDVCSTPLPPAFCGQSIRGVPGVSYVPISQCDYDFIVAFMQIYPTISNIIGGGQSLPSECLQMTSSIPANYDFLTTVPEYLWRFNDYSYTRYVDFVNSSRVVVSINSRISDKIRYLKTL